jgi:S-methylmethionine-dependent homocysteine/selenocysteine methylase
MPDTFEVEVLLELLKDCTTPFWVTYSCKEGNQTNAGQSFSDAVSLAQPALAVGINCTKPELIEGLLNSAKSDNHLLFIQTQAGFGMLRKNNGLEVLQLVLIRR